MSKEQLLRIALFIFYVFISLGIVVGLLKVSVVIMLKPVHHSTCMGEGDPRYIIGVHLQNQSESTSEQLQLQNKFCWDIGGSLVPRLYHFTVTEFSVGDPYLS